MSTPALWRRVFLPFAAGYFFSYFLRNANAVIAPELTHELGISATELGLLTSVYLLAFAVAQLPLGILLDRYGARRVEAGLLLIAASGCALFALGDSLLQLATGRALIGLGVSACLMASFKAFGAWFGSARQASLNAAIMAAGGLGALVASAPLSWAVPQFGWRGIFTVLALAGVMAAAAVFSTPERPGSALAEPLRRQLAGVAAVLTSRVFWRFAPQSALVIGGFMALQGLWAVPWLMVVVGLSRTDAAHHLLLMGLGMLCGFVAIAVGVAPLAARGISAERLLTAGMALGLLVTGCILFDMGARAPLWFALGLVFSTGNLTYALLQAHYPVALSGRVNTALNLMVFVGAFSIQWGFGAALDGLQAAGWAARDAFRITLGVLLAAQLAGWLWFLRQR